MNFLKHPVVLVAIGVVLGYMFSDRLATLPLVKSLPKF